MRCLAGGSPSHRRGRCCRWCGWCDPLRSSPGRRRGCQGGRPLSRGAVLRPAPGLRGQSGLHRLLQGLRLFRLLRCVGLTGPAAAGRPGVCLRRRVGVVLRGPYGVMTSGQRGVRLTGRGRDPVGLGGRERERGPRPCRLGRNGPVLRGPERPPGPPPGRLRLGLALLRAALALPLAGGRSDCREGQLILVALTSAVSARRHRHRHLGRNTLRRHGLPALRTAATTLCALGRRHDGALGRRRGSGQSQRLPGPLPRLRRLGGLCGQRGLHGRSGRLGRAGPPRLRPDPSPCCWAGTSP